MNPRTPERSDPGRSPLTALGWALIVAAVLVMGGAVALYFSRPEPLPEGATLDFEIATKAFTNAEGGYEIHYPPRWRLDEAGTVTRVLSPSRDISVTFGNAPDGPLRESAAVLLDRVVRSYRDPRLTAVEVRNIQGSLAALVAGTATNRAGVPLRFLVISISTARGNYGVSVFAAASSDPTTVLPPVQEMVASFRLTAA